jgi:hypothetical protein
MAAGDDDRSEHVDVILAEMQVRLDALSRRADSTSSRAGLLIASSAITLALIEQKIPHWALVTSLILGVGAILCGVYAVFPSKANYTPLLDVREGIYTRGITRAKLWLADDKIRFYNESVDRLYKRGWAVRIGFVALATSVAAAGLGILLGR